jgi:hypothetical protein
MSTPKKYRLLLIVLLSPLLFINVRDSHDWGDDFAQYLIQARNLVEFKLQTANGLIVDKESPEYAVAAYPVGFPLLLAPVYFISGLEIRPFLSLISLFLVSAGMLCFSFFRNKSGEAISLLIVLLFCFNPQVLELKKQILSEIPFLCFICLLMVWRESDDFRKKHAWLITGAILAGTVSIRLAGVAVVAGYILFELFIAVKNRTSIQKNIFTLSLSLLFAALLFTLLHVVLFPANQGDVMGFYAREFYSHSLSLKHNLVHYYEIAGNIFPLFSWRIPSAWILISLLGWVIKLFRNPSLPEFILPLYLLLMLHYPYSAGGSRFLVPVLPLLIYYTGYAIEMTFVFRKAVSKKVVSAVYLTLLIGCVPSLGRTIQDQKETEEGPQKKEAIELFDYLKTYSEEIPVAFCRARLIYLYTGHASLYYNPAENTHAVYRRFARQGRLLVVAGKPIPGNVLYDSKLSEVLENHKNQYEKKWENEEFIVYEQRSGKDIY